MPWEPAATSFGITAAALLVGGSVLLRFQRDRHHFLLMKAAIEKGITTFPGATPGWLVSLRIGTLTLVLGVGMMIVGALLQLHTSTPAVQGEPLPSASSAPIPRDSSPSLPPPPSPEMERRHRIENQDLAGRVALCAGILVAMLGAVRILFARLERKYVGGSPSPPPHE